MTLNSPLNIHHIVIAVNVFVKKDDKYLVLRRSVQKEVLPGLIHPIGGKIDENEEPLLAAQRELFEESGVTVTNIKLEAVVTEVLAEDDPKYKNNWLIFHFSGDYESGEVTESDEGELIWMEKEELLAATMFPSIQTILPHILNPQDGPVFARFEYDEDRNIISKNIALTNR